MRTIRCATISRDMTQERASEKDRDYFRRLGEWKAQLKAEDLRQFLALSPKARQERAERHIRDSRDYARNLPQGTDFPVLFEKAKQLGLYRA